MSAARPALLPLLALALALTGVSEAAAAPSTVAVHGAMQATGGAQSADGKYLLKFAIYSAEKAGTASWSEPPVSIVVQNGTFRHVLGLTKPLTPELITALPKAWLGVTVDVDPELPRVPLHAVTSALVAGGLSCTGCVESKHLGDGSISAQKLGFAFAASATKGGPATSALSLQCTGCVSVAALKFDGDMNLGGNGLAAKKISATAIAAATISAQSFVGDGSQLSGIKVPASACKNADEQVKGINADGSVLCGKGGGLPPDGIDEISNGLIFNQFIDSALSSKPLPILDSNPIGSVSEIDVPSVGVAQKLTVHVEVENSNVAGLTLTLFDPNNVGYVLLKEGQGKGQKLVATYPDPDATVSGDLTKWEGQNPAGIWRLKVVDNLHLNDGLDGQVKLWRVDIQTLSNKKIQIKGDLYVDGAGHFGDGLRMGDVKQACTTATAGAMRFNGAYFEGCTGGEWTAFIGPAATQSAAIADCAAIKKLYPQAKDGIYWIDPNGGDKADAVQAVCDMTRDGGGWTLGVKHWSGSGIQGRAAAVGHVASALTLKGSPYKLSDATINAVIGKAHNFDVLFDQSGYNHTYSKGNYEYAVIRNYTALWTWAGPTLGSTSPTKFRSYRLSDDAVAWEGNFKCGGHGGWGINCYTVTAGTNPQAGAGCKINMGKSSNAGWHHVYMATGGADSYLYLCNGPQHSSGHVMNHRFWFRKALK